VWCVVGAGCGWWGGVGRGVGRAEEGGVWILWGGGG